MDGYGVEGDGSTVARISPESLREAGRLLRAGRLVAFPTETVYGLGANALDPVAVREIYRAKGRPSDNPLIVHVADPADARALSRDWTPLAERLAEAFWPGPLTLVVGASFTVPDVTRGGLDTVAIRVPEHPVARAVIHAAARPVAAPSANRSGRPSPTRADDVAQDLGIRVALILDGGPTRIGLESTVVDVSEGHAVLLRPGGLPREALERVVGQLAEPATDGPARSPGMRYRHYAPDTPVVLLEAEGDAAVQAIRRRWSPEEAAVMGSTAVVAALQDYTTWDLGPTAETAASRLFRGLRALDEAGVPVLLAVWKDRAGLGGAVWNRLMRAAEEVRAP